MPGLEDQAQERMIGDATYRVFPLPYSKGKKVALALLRVIGPVLKAASLGGTAQEVGAEVFNALPLALSEADFDMFERTFADVSFYLGPDGSTWVPMAAPATRELHFAARYDAVLAWLVFHLEVNFASLFRGGVIKNSVEGLKDLIAPKKTTAT